MESKQDISQQNPDEQCLNCSYAPLSIEAKFCPACGQDCKNKRTTIWSLIKEALDNFFNLDNKLWQSLLFLFVPGRLTKEYLRGRRQRYVSPLRFFLITGVIFFSVIQMKNASGVDELFDSATDDLKKNSFYGGFLEKLSLESDTVQVDFEEYTGTEIVLDSLEQRMHRSYSDSATIGLVNIFIEEDSLKKLTIAYKDLARLSQDSLVSIYGNGHFWDDLLLKQNIKLAIRGENFLSYLLGQLVWMMLIMMPFLALFLKLLYIRGKFFYVDHLIFLFHTHAFIFVLYSLLLVLNTYWPGFAFLSSINTLGAISMPVYLFIAMRRVYNQSKTKTFVKLFLINFFYVILFILSILLTSLIAALNF